jgi:hypothetical protein
LSICLSLPNWRCARSRGGARRRAQSAREVPSVGQPDGERPASRYPAIDRQNLPIDERGGIACRKHGGRRDILRQAWPWHRLPHSLEALENAANRIG